MRSSATVRVLERGPRRRRGTSASPTGSTGAALGAARKVLDAAIVEVDAKGRLLRQAAAERRMPTAAEQVDVIARAAAEFEATATQLHGETEKLLKAAGDAYNELDALVHRESMNAARAEENLKGGRDALAEAVGQLYEQAAEFGQYARAERRPVAGRCPLAGRRAHLRRHHRGADQGR